MRTLVTIVTLLLIWLLSFILGEFTHDWVGLISGGLLTFLFVYSSIRVVPADPPHKAILVFLGKRQKIVLNEGWNWLPLSPIIFDAILIEVRKVNQDLTEQEVRTPDYASLLMKISITWTPGRKGTNEEQAEALIEYLNSGEKEGVKTIIEDVIKDRLRAWAFSEEGGPSDWKEAIGAKDDAVAILLKAILGDELPRVDSDIPTQVLLRYFQGLKPLRIQAETYGKNWEVLEQELNKLSEDSRRILKEQVERRLMVIKKIRRGNGAFYMPSLGITINRFTIDEIALSGQTKEAVESRAREAYEREADEIEIRNVLQRTRELMQDLGISAEQALEIVQTERGKVVKSIKEGKINISPETRETLERIFPELASILRR
jgi:regulator of protease activity HflC (stomatin/prohibitin superfamily)